MTKLRDEPCVASQVLEGRVVVVDDEPINLRIVRKYLANAGLTDCICLSDPTDLKTRISEMKPDVVLLDVMMPDASGLDLLSELKADERTSGIPILILTASTDRKIRREALDRGARDFIPKPIDPDELVARLRNTIAAKRADDQLRLNANLLRDEVSAQTREIALTRVEVVHCLARAAEFRDNETGHHILRVGRYSSILAHALGCDAHFIQLLELAAPLHDVGKIGIPDEILLKSGKLTADEFALMQKHTTMGGRVFTTLTDREESFVRRHSEIGAKIFGEPQFELLSMAKIIAMTHHERFDGTGYPLGLKGHDIPLCGRIVAVADVFDALSSKRPYKPAFPREKCFEILADGRGTHFDPAILDAFFSQSSAITSIQVELADM